MAIPQNGNFFQPAIDAITKPQAPSAGGVMGRPSPQIARPFSGSCEQPDFLYHIISQNDLNANPTTSNLNRLVDIPGDAIYISGPRNGLKFPLFIHFKPIEGMIAFDESSPGGSFDICPGLRVQTGFGTDYRLFKFCCGFQRFYISWRNLGQVQSGDLIIQVFPKGVVETFAGTAG